MPTIQDLGAGGGDVIVDEKEDLKKLADIDRVNEEDDDVIILNEPESHSLCQ